MRFRIHVSTCSVVAYLIIVHDSNEEVKLTCSFFLTFLVYLGSEKRLRIKGAIHYFQSPNSLNKKFSELNNNDGIIIHDH